MQRVTVTTHLNSFTGYGQLSNEVIRGLVHKGYDVNVRAVAKSEPFGSRIPVDILARCVARPQQEPWEILIHPPDFAPTPGKKTAYFTMWETARITPAAKTFLNQADLILTPSAWNAACFSAAGIDKPIRIVPLGVDPSIYRYQRLPESEPFIFGAAGRTAHGGARKGIDDVIEAFSQAFPAGEPGSRRFRLKVKLFPDCEAKDPQDDRIEFIRGFLPEEKMVEWLASIHCFVSAARGEGWGLLQHQAMAIGRPVIAPKYGGLAEFMTDENSFPVPFKLVPSGRFYKGCGVWAEVDVGDLVNMMLTVTAHFSWPHFEETAWKASRDARRFSWDRCVNKLQNAMVEFGIV